jgi:hypothetical protein
MEGGRVRYGRGGRKLLLPSQGCLSAMSIGTHFMKSKNYLRCPCTIFALYACKWYYDKKFTLKICKNQGMVVHACNPSTQETEAGGL